MDAPALSALLDRLTETEIELGGVSAHLDRATRALAGEAEALRRTATELDEELRRARLIPLDWAFARLPHALRELERTTGRAADIELSGGEIEVDKALVEQMADALLHLLRNAFAHGMESPAEREGRGQTAARAAGGERPPGRRAGVHRVRRRRPGHRSRRGPAGAGPRRRAPFPAPGPRPIGRCWPPSSSRASRSGRRPTVWPAGAWASTSSSGR